MSESIFKIEFYVPVSHLESVKQAVFDAGAGQIGHYDQCAWQTVGQGQFRPAPGSKPYLGAVGELETVDEYKVELVCAEANLKRAVAALRDSHPYEEPAYGVIKLITG